MYFYFLWFYHLKTIEKLVTVGKNFEKSVTCHQADLSSSNRLDFILKWVCICLKEIMEKMIWKNDRHTISNCIEIVHLFLPKRIQWMFCTQIVHTWHGQEKRQSNMKNNWSKWLFYSVETIFLSKMVESRGRDEGRRGRSVKGGGAKKVKTLPTFYIEEASLELEMKE